MGFRSIWFLDTPEVCICLYDRLSKSAFGSEFFIIKQQLFQYLDMYIQTSYTNVYSCYRYIVFIN